MSKINILVEKKIQKNPKEIQEILIKAIELAEHSQPTAISEQLEGLLRGIAKISEKK